MMMTTIARLRYLGPYACKFGAMFPSLGYPKKLYGTRDNSTTLSQKVSKMKLNWHAGECYCFLCLYLQAVVTW